MFENASIQKYRYPSSKGELTTEQLWDLPLRLSNFSLNAVAQDLSHTLNATAQTNFVDVGINQEAIDTHNKLEIVKHIITRRLEAIETHKKRDEKKAKRVVILDALAKQEATELTQSSREELLKKLEELDD